METAFCSLEAVRIGGYERGIRKDDLFTQRMLAKEKVPKRLKQILNERGKKGVPGISPLLVGRKDLGIAEGGESGKNWGGGEGNLLFGERVNSGEPLHARGVVLFKGDLEGANQLWKMLYRSFI